MGHVIVLHQGRVLAQGRPGASRRSLEGRVFVAELAQARAQEREVKLLDERMSSCCAGWWASAGLCGRHRMKACPTARSGRSG